MDRLPDRDAYKTPAEVLDYTFLWGDYLGSDTIDTSTWTPETGITVPGDSTEGQDVTVWIAGGTIRKTYRAVNRITTPGGRTAERTLNVHIVKHR